MDFLEFENLSINEDKTFKGRLGFFTGMHLPVALLHNHKTCCLDLDTKKNPHILKDVQIQAFEEFLCDCGIDVSDNFLDEQVLIVETKSGGRHYVFKNNGCITYKSKLLIPFQDAFLHVDFLANNSISFFSVPWGSYKVLQKPLKLAFIGSLDLSKLSMYITVPKNEKSGTELKFSEFIEESDLRSILNELTRVLQKSYSYEIWYLISNFIAFHSKSYEDGLAKFHYFSKQTYGYESYDVVERQFKSSYNNLKSQETTIFYESLKNILKGNGFLIETLPCENRIIIPEVEQFLKEYSSLSVQKEVFEEIKKDVQKEEKKEKDEIEVICDKINEICISLMNESGFFGELATFIYENTSPKIPNFAVYTAFSICSCLLSWDYGASLHKTKGTAPLNLWTVLINESSTGKDTYIKIVEYFIRNMHNNKFPCCFEGSNPTSINGLEVIFRNNYYKRNVLVTYDEYLTKSFLKRESRESYTADLKGALSALYDGTLKPPTTKLSMTSKPILSCMFNVFGVSVPSFREFDMKQGIINRHMFVYPSVKVETNSFEEELKFLFNENKHIKTTFSERLETFFNTFKNKYLDKFMKIKTKKDLFKRYLDEGIINREICDDENLLELSPEKALKDTKEATKKEIDDLLCSEIWYPSLIKASESEHYQDDVPTLYQAFMKYENEKMFNTDLKCFIEKESNLKEGLRGRISYISAKMACILSISRNKYFIDKSTFLDMFSLCYMTRNIQSLLIQNEVVEYTQQEKSFASIIDDVYNRIKDDLFWDKITKQKNVLTPSKAVAFIYCLKGVRSKDVGEIFARIATLYPDSFETQMDGKSILLKKKVS